MTIRDRQELLSIKEKYQHQLANQLVTAVLVLDDSLTIQYLNPAAEALLSKSFNRTIGKNFFDIAYASSISSERLQQLLITGQEFSDADVRLDVKEIKPMSVEITASYVEFDKAPHVLLEFKQIDKQKQISAEAFQQQQWENARDLIRGLAHEIKNPLGGLRGAAQLLNKELNDTQKEYTAMIIEQSDRLTNLVDRLLGPNQLPNMSVQNIHLVLEKVSQLTSFNNPKGIKICRDYDPSIPEICFDEEKLQQAVLNIVSNAIQVIDADDTVTLKTRIASNQTINNQLVKMCVRISIIDTGPGIPPNIQDTLFYPMVSGRANGTGLGLSISQTLINQHSGKLSCVSYPGHTEFIILLPISEEGSP
ncbi:nitrogen regulation protein NR(II) [Thalassotalea agarivorans]|uniref:Sensory histidine kinase/phosphatase NtrB n=1 Tax=Thalassotalea agarivorans TaxID=349064 RepID=A0A1I0HVA7_THASX|nr:nitrogen regulation protein NR(II) [Thalassotalea agarivorans]SET87989.1 two-component system, NtrC family, nitrogen regulation sensor histidine kinase GlnL [Thalassotalea agarivorans]